MYDVLCLMYDVCFYLRLHEQYILSLIILHILAQRSRSTIHSSDLHVVVEKFKPATMSYNHPKSHR